MKLIDNITDSANQQTRIILDSGKVVLIDLLYIPFSKQWIMNVNYNNNEFIINGIIILYGENLLNQFSNILPFGIACLTSDFSEPQYVDDFQKGRVELYILNEDDLSEISQITL